MHAWEHIQQTIEFIEDHLNEELDIGSLAKMASLSPFYYQRLFRRLVKKPVAEYIKLRRMAKANEMLLQKENRILDVALDLGYSSQEHFSRNFKSTFGITPNEYRNNPRKLNRMTKPELLLHYTLIDEGVPLITEGIVLEINRRVILEPIHFAGIQRDVPIQFVEGLSTESGIDPLDSLWRNFHDQKQTFIGLDEDAEEIGVSFPSLEEEHFCYFAGAKSSYGEVPSNFSKWELSSGEYIVCSIEGENFDCLVMDSLYKAQQYIYNTWLPKHQLKIEDFCAERYVSHSPETTNMEIWLKQK